MRVRGRSKQQSSSGVDLHQGRDERAQTFRNRHRTGQRISGRFIKRDKSGLAWVSFDGLALLAKLETNPTPTARLSFIIQTLTPDIVLRELRGNASGGHGQASLVPDFDALRSAFENIARPVLTATMPTSLDFGQRRDMLLNALSPDAIKHYHKTVLAQIRINTLLANGPTCFFYLPWLVPGALRQDLILRREEKQDGTIYLEVAYGFEPAGLGPAQVRILSRPGRSSVRLFLERSEHLPAARIVLKVLGKNMDDRVTLLDVVKPPKYARGGVLSELLAPDPHKLIGLGG